MQLLPYRIQVTGWRHWPRTASYVVHAVLAELARDALRTGQPVMVRDGQCPYGGVDDYAYEWSQYTSGVSGQRVPAQWAEFGQAAGSIRNQAMVNMGADVCAAFPGPPTLKYSGTQDCADRARKAGIMVVTVPWAEWFGEEPTRFNPCIYVQEPVTPQLGW